MLRGLLDTARRIFQRHRAEQELDEELAFHVEMETARNIELGMEPADARRRALVDLGGDLQVREAVQDERRLGLDALWQDVRCGVRLCLRRPVSSIVALLTLAVGLGASVGVFSVVSALLLRPLPFRGADRLVDLHVFPKSATTSTGLREWVARGSYLSSALFTRTAPAPLGMGERADTAVVTRTTATFFSVLGVGVSQGRGFIEDEGTPGRDMVAVVSHRFARRVFGEHANSIGHTLRISGEAYTIIGVAETGMEFPGGTDAWVPTAFDSARPLDMSSMAAIPIAIGRLRDGVTPKQADALLSAEAGRWSAFDGAFSKRGEFGASLVPLRDELTGPVRGAVVALFASVLFVLLVAGTNVAHLLLARVLERDQELRIRRALGASRWRIVRQLALEHIVLLASASVLGLVIASWVVSAASTVETRLPFTPEYRLLDWPVAGFGVALVVLFGLATAAVPAWIDDVRQAAAGPDRLKGPSSSSGRTRRVTQLMLSLQVALALGLVTGAVAMGHRFVDLVTTDLGLRPAHVASFTLRFSGTPFTARERQAPLVAEVLRRLRLVPGVATTSVTEVLPLDPQPTFSAANVRDRTGVPMPVGVVIVSPGYFRTMGIEIVRGREFIQGDERSSELLAIADETLARRFSNTGGAVGQMVTLDWYQQPRFRVIGVSRRVRYSGPAEIGTGSPTLFVLAEHRRTTPRQLSFVARLDDDTASTRAACKAAILTVDPHLAVEGPVMLEDRLSALMSSPRFYTRSIVAFGLFALLLAALGVYATAANAVAQRTHEIGVRLALGAGIHRVRRLVVLETLWPVAPGLALGVLGSTALAGSLSHMVPTGFTVGLAMHLSGTGIMTVAALVAAWGATSRMLRLQPTDVLRAD